MTTDAPKRTSRKGIPNHPIEFRRHLAKLACEPDVSVARLAMEHGVNPNLVFKWRRALRAGEYDPVDLVPVTVDPRTALISLKVPTQLRAWRDLYVRLIMYVGESNGEENENLS